MNPEPAGSCHDHPSSDMFVFIGNMHTARVLRSPSSRVWWTCPNHCREHSSSPSRMEWVYV